MLTDLEARKIASTWHGGGGSKLHALASTGTIVGSGSLFCPYRGTVDEINDTMYTIVGADPHGTDAQSAAEEAGERAELRDLIEYCITHGERGPQDGWGSLTW